jgi:hypothetical protein
VSDVADGVDDPFGRDDMSRTPAIHAATLADA